MFKKTLAEALNQIFLIQKVTFEAKTDKEQNVLFVDVAECRSTIRPPEERARVTGTLVLYAPNTKLPYGFFAKAIAAADPELTQPFFFHKMDQSGEYYNDLVELRCEFVYFYSAEYDPEQGELDECEFIFE